MKAKIKPVDASSDEAKERERWERDQAIKKIEKKKDLKENIAYFSVGVAEGVTTATIIAGGVKATNMFMDSIYKDREKDWAYWVFKCYGWLTSAILGNFVASKVGNDIEDKFYEKYLISEKILGDRSITEKWIKPEAKSVEERIPVEKIKQMIEKGTWFGSEEEAQVLWFLRIYPGLSPNKKVKQRPQECNGELFSSYYKCEVYNILKDLYPTEKYDAYFCWKKEPEDGQHPIDLIYKNDPELRKMS